MNTPKQKKLEEINKFPNWFGCLSPTKPKEESEPDREQVEQLPHHKQPLPSEESSISMRSRHPNSVRMLETTVPCLVKQPKQPEVKGLIREDKGDRFIVYIPDSDSTITVSKLFVYPDFSKSDGQINKCSSKNRHETNAKVSGISDKCSSKINPPSKNCSSKTRRLKGEGSGAIFYRTVTSQGRDYQQAYYHWRENDRQRTKYIPKKLLGRVEEAESSKLPVSDILVLLVGTGKCSSKSSVTSIISTDDKVIDTLDNCSSKTIPTSKRRRDKGKGSGWIQCKPIKRSGKEYKQYWYHYEEWEGGGRLLKKSSYIPKKLWSKIEQMDNDKVPVVDILRVLRKKKKQ